MGRCRRSRRRGWIESTGGRWDTAVVEQRISLVTLGVADLARARAFYEAMGWRDAIQPDDEVAFYQAGGMVFGLWARSSGRPRRPAGEGIQAPSRILTAMCGKSRTTPTGSSTRTARSACASNVRASPSN